MSRDVLLRCLLCAAAIAPARAAAQACVFSSEDLEVRAIRVTAGEEAVVVALDHAQLSIDARTARAEVRRPLEVVGAANVAWRTARAVELEGAVFIPPGTPVTPGAGEAEGSLRLASVAAQHTSVSYAGVPVTCDAIELGAALPAPADWAQRRDADRPVPTGVQWVSRGGRLTLRARPDAAATAISLGGLGSYALLTEIGREGSWARLAVRFMDGAEIRAWAQVVDLEPPPRGGGGAIGGFGGGRCEPPTPPPSAFEGELELPAGTELHVSPGGARWARVPVATRGRVRYEVGVLAGGEEWARILGIDGVRPLGSGRCATTDLPSTFARVAALPIPDLDGLRARARASEPQPIGAVAVREARRDRAVPYSRFALGRGHGCALREGRVWCWGVNDEGQLGDGTTTSRDEARAIGGLDGVLELARVGASTCALRGDGSVRCWGAFVGQMHLSPVPLEGIEGAVSIGGGTAHGCAVLADGRLACWGHPPGEVGSGTGVVEVRGIADAIAVAGGGGHACVLRAGGELVCWGQNGSRQLGAAGTHPRPTAVPPITDVVQVVAYGERTCAVVRGGAAHCWGSAYSGSLGLSEHSGVEAPSLVLDRVEEIALGGTFVCFRRDDASVACFAGYSDREVLAGGVSSPGRPHVMDALRAAAIGASDSGVCVLDDRGATSCWGERRVLGSAPVEGLAPARAVAAGYRESCAVLRDGQVACWPAEPHAYIHFADARELALGAGGRCAIDSRGSVQCDGLLQGTGWTDASAVAVGSGLVCGIVSGRVQCVAGRSSIGGGLTGEVPHDVLGDAIDVAVSGSQVCVAERSGRVVCWRMGGDGEEGEPPEVVVGLSDAVQLGLAFRWGCARTAAGAILCFAEHGPRELRGLRGARDLSVGGAGACVVRAQGDVACFTHQHGTRAEPGDRFTRPTIVPGTRGATSVSVGAEHACAVLESGAVRCWGTATGGRVDGRAGPTLVPGT